MGRQTLLNRIHLIKCHRQGLLNEHVLAGVQCITHHPSMQIVWSGDEDSIDIRIRQNGIHVIRSMLKPKLSGRMSR